MKKVIAMILALAALTAILAGCGSSETAPWPLPPRLPPKPPARWMPTA